MYIFEAVLESLSDGQWKVTLSLPKEWGHEMEHFESPAGQDDVAAKAWAAGEIRAKGFTEQFGWYFIEDGKHAMQVTV